MPACQSAAVPFVANSGVTYLRLSSCVAFESEDPKSISSSIQIRLLRLLTGTQIDNPARLNYMVRRLRGDVEYRTRAH
jgi:hypothetical protein